MLPAPRERVLLRRYQLVLHRQPGWSLLQVTRLLQHLTHFAETEAMQRMWQATHWGEAIVLESHLERIELYQEQFALCGLRVTIEPIC